MKQTRVAGIDLSRKYICMECGCQRDPIEVKRGLLFIEICMWLLYVLPGVIYSIWRRVRRQKVCPKCLNPSVVLTSSSRVREMMRMIKSFSPQPGPVSGNRARDVSRKKVSSKPENKNLNQILKTSSRRKLKPKGQQGIIDFKAPDKNQ